MNQPSGLAKNESPIFGLILLSNISLNINQNKANKILNITVFSMLALKKFISVVM